MPESMKWRLFEFEDLEGFPSVIREGMTDYLRFLFNSTNLYKPIIPLLAEAYRKNGSQKIIDLCSGSGGSVERIQKGLSLYLEKQVPFVLTDKFPNIPSYKYLEEKTGGTFSYVNQSVDAINVSSNLNGFRTIFSGFHHFDKTVAKAVLKDAVDKKQGIAVFDGGDKNVLMILVILILHPLIFFFCTPFFKPFRVSRFVFTYLIPVIPFCTIWDGIVSVTRLYSPKELLSIAPDQTDAGYEWRSGKIKNQLGFNIAYLIGTPKNQN